MSEPYEIPALRSAIATWEEDVGVPDHANVIDGVTAHEMIGGFLTGLLEKFVAQGEKMSDETKTDDAQW